jgi:beta-1,4-N-acetylglucosaminyltransferase
MFALLRDLDTRKYTYRTYVVSSGDGFSAQRAVAFEKGLEERVAGGNDAKTEEDVGGYKGDIPQIALNGKKEVRGWEKHWVGPEHYTISIIPRARRVHQPLYTTPLTAVKTLLAAFGPLLSSASQPQQKRTNKGDDANLPTLILTNGPATAVIVILAAYILRFFNVRGAESRGLCRTVYVESFARVTRLSLSGKLLVRVVDRFLVQWEALEGAGGGRAEFCGVLV